MNNKSNVLKEKVIARLVRCGHNQESATRWTEEHFEYASKYYSGANKIAEVIQNL